MTATVPRGETTRARDPGFDGLRAIAALGIVVFHAASIAGLNARRYVGIYTARLDAAVAIFFVLSGALLYGPFVAAHVDGRAGRSISGYAWRRALRIYPAYWVALVAAIALFHSTELSGVADYVRHFALVQIYTPSYGLAGIIPTWTLAVEVSFYVALPLYAAALHAFTRRARAPLPVELTGVAVVYAAAMVTRILIDRHSGTDAVSLRWLPAMADWFALGLLLAVLSVALARDASRGAGRVAATLRAHPGAAWAAAVVAFVASAHLGLPTDGRSGTTAQDLARQILFGLFAALLVAPAALGSGGGVRRALTWRPLVLVGLVSYGVFLWHFDWLEQLGDFGVSTHGYGGFVALLALALPLTLVCAAASWLVVETPALRFAARRVTATEHREAAR